jgi:hypothetical protein
MAGFSDHIIQKILNHVFGNTVYAPVTPQYFALFTALPNDAGNGGLEPSTGSYARLSKANDGALWQSTSPGSGLKTNLAVLTFVTPTADWGTIVGVGIFEAASAGNMIAFQSIPNTPVLNGQAFVIPSGSLRITLN